jgi:putative nucleotidyltransferase with HDIG domain
MSVHLVATVTMPDAIVRGIKKLEPLPVTAQRLFDLMNGKDVSLARIAELIEFDQAIAAAVLREASTARYSGRPLSSVRDAVFRLGTVTLLNLVLDGYLAKLRASAPAYDLSEQDLWLHGAAARLAVRALRLERPKAGIPEAAETAALIHDVGKLIVSRCLKASAGDILALVEIKGVTFVEAERELFGTDHAAVGAAMAVHWQFPSAIADAIRRHHDPHIQSPTPLIDVLMMANVVAKTIEAGTGAEGFDFNVDPGVRERLGIDADGFGRVTLEAQTWLRDLARANGVTY